MKPRFKAPNQPNRNEVISETRIMPVRPNVPGDVPPIREAKFEPGQLPKGGYMPMWNFGDQQGTRLSPTVANGKKVY